MIAGAQRELTKDLDLSTLQKVDRLLKLDQRFKGRWIGSPWFVCPDVYCIPATMPVPQILESIAEHGEPCGIVGMALLPQSQTYRVLKVQFRSNKECKQAVNKSAESATDKFIDTAQKIIDLHKGKGDA
jgi:hypothetical protein